MKPRNREEDEFPPPPEPSPAPALPVRRAGRGLSSMVVRPPESSFRDGSEDAEEARESGAGDDRRRDSPQPHRRDSQPHRRDSLPPGRRRGSLQDQRRRDSPMSFSRRGSPLDILRRAGSPGFQPRYNRFHDSPGSLSPRPQRLEGHYDPDFDSSMGQRYGRGSRGGRAGGRFQEGSPGYGHGRGRRPLGRGYNSSGWPVPEGEYIHRNDPNLSPREGDWICQNPSCGNLNFARRTHCNNCNKYRYGPDLHGPGLSPRRGYFKSPPLRGFPLRILGPTDRVLRGDLDRYRSPPQGWGIEDPRNFGPRSPPPARGGKFAEDMHRERLDYHNKLEYRQRRKFDWPAPELDDRDNRDVPSSNGRDYDRRPMLPHGRWISRDRSRSPPGDRSLRSGYFGRGRDDRQRDSFLGRDRADNMSLVHGRGYHQADSFSGRGNIDRRGIARGRDDHIY